MAPIDFNDALAIHFAIHEGREVVAIKGKELKIFKAKNGCRMTSYNGTTFMEQNKTKPGKYGACARKGEMLTWILPEWGLLRGEKYEKICSLVKPPTTERKQSEEFKEEFSESKRKEASPDSSPEESAKKRRLHKKIHSIEIQFPI
jgi:hypothetical protein